MLISACCRATFRIIGVKIEQAIQNTRRSKDTTRARGNEVGGHLNVRAAWSDDLPVISVNLKGCSPLVDTWCSEAFGIDSDGLVFDHNKSCRSCRLKDRS